MRTYPSSLMKPEEIKLEGEEFELALSSSRKGAKAGHIWGLMAVASFVEQMQIRSVSPAWGWRTTAIAAAA